MSRVLTWALRLLPVLGLVLVVIGSQEWYPETWLDSKGFVINLASGATAACFGLPLAFFVLQRLLAERAIVNENSSLIQSTFRSIAEIWYRTIPSCTFSFLPGQFWQWRNLMVEARGQLHIALQNYDAEPSAATARVVHKETVSLTELFKKATLAGPLYTQESEQNSERVNVQLAYLSVTNPQLIARGFPNFPTNRLEDIRDYLRWEEEEKSAVEYSLNQMADRIPHYTYASKSLVNSHHALRAAVQEILTHKSKSGKALPPSPLGDGSHTKVMEVFATFSQDGLPASRKDFHQAEEERLRCVACVWELHNRSLAVDELVQRLDSCFAAVDDLIEHVAVLVNSNMARPNNEDATAPPSATSHLTRFMMDTGKIKQEE